MHHGVGSQYHSRNHSLTSTSIRHVDVPMDKDDDEGGFMKTGNPSICCGLTDRNSYNKRRSDLRIWMFQTDEGAAWDVWIMFLCLISVLVFIAQTYIEDETPDAGNSNVTDAVNNYLALSDGVGLLSADILETTIVVEFVCALFFIHRIHCVVIIPFTFRGALSSIWVRTPPDCVIRSVIRCSLWFCNHSHTSFLSVFLIHSSMIVGM